MNGARAIRLGTASVLRYRTVMTELETQILSKLEELERAAAEMSTAQPKPDLMGIFAALDNYAAQLPADAHPDLRHFLDRKSYQKAQLLLQGRRDEVRRGTCGR